MQRRLCCLNFTVIYSSWILAIHIHCCGYKFQLKFNAKEIVISCVNWEKSEFILSNDKWAEINSRSMSQRLCKTVLWFADKNGEENFSIVSFVVVFFHSSKSLWLNWIVITFTFSSVCLFDLVLCWFSLAQISFQAHFSVCCAMSCLFFKCYIVLFISTSWHLIHRLSANFTLSFTHSSGSSSWAAKRYLRLDLTAFNRFRFENRAIQF